MATPQKSRHFRDALYFIWVCGAREWIARLLLLLLLVATVSIHRPHLLVFLSSPGDADGSRVAEERSNSARLG
ncbi:hypothetical protein C4D60_Mb10t12800 [Musa balbisiana]|uniref:Uncharacterized protein n=1 Tax=Musa balbisiana TaxID=52838 RepID=A0A4S8IY26_MUSBA|nr:hypothetical protein C4D60_Mb10t12800 [Musa balbisiana]